MFVNYPKKKRYVAAGIGGLIAAILLIGVAPSFSATAPVAESDPTTSAIPTQTEGLVEDKLKVSEWHPRDLPSAGMPYLYIVELQGIPQSYNKLNFVDAPWLIGAIDNKGQFENVPRTVDIGRGHVDGKLVDLGQVVQLDKAKLNSYFDFYEQARTVSPFFEVTFPDGSVKYYDVMYTEVP